MAMNVGFVTLYPYGLALAIGAAICLFWAAKRMQKAELGTDSGLWLAVTAVPLCVFCSRLSYCLVRFSWFCDQGLGWFFRLSEGGFFLFGTIVGLLLACLMTGKLTKQDPARIMDAAAAPATLMLTFARLAEGLVHQGYGWCISDWFSVDAFDPEEYSGMSLFHLEDIDFFCRWPFAVENQMYGEFYWAVYMAEALIALIITLLLLRTVTKRPGWLAMKALVMVCAMQLLGESLRQDAVLRWGFVRVGQILGAVVLVAVLMFCCIKAPKASKKLMAGSWLGLLASFGLFMAMEFALEKKIVMLEFLPMDVCYLIMTFSCIGMIYAIRPLWKLSDAAT